MKKMNTLFRLWTLACCLLPLTVWGELPATGETGYLYNAATGKFLAHGVTSVSNSGALVDDYGVPVEVKNEGAASEFADHTYLRFQMADYYGRYLRVVAGGLDCAGSSYHKWAVSEVEGGFVIRCIYQPSQVAYATQGHYVAIADDGSLVLVEGMDNAAVWQWTTAAEQKALVAAADKARLLGIAEKAGFEVTTPEELETALAGMTAVDKTESITNPTLYSNLDGWTVNNIQGTAINNGSYQIQNAAGTQATCTQTVTGLAPGIYRVQVQAFYRASVLARCKTFGDNGYKFTNAYFEANDNKMQIIDWYSIATDDYTKPASRVHIKDEFNEAEKYTNTLYTYVGEDGKLTITIAVPSYSNGDYPNWICFNNVRLTYYFEAEDLTVYEGLLAQAVSEANALVLPTLQKSILDGVIEEYNKEYTTSADYETAIQAINDAKTAAQPFTEPYAQYNALKLLIQQKFIDLTDSYTDAEGAATDTYNGQVTTLDATVGNAESVEVINDAITTLWANTLDWLKAVEIDKEKGFDLTWMIQDADFSDTNYKKYWTETGVSGGTVGVTNGVMRYMNTVFDLGQELPYLMPAGSYKLTVDGFERTANPLSSAYSNYTAGTSAVSGCIYLNANEQKVWDLLAMQDVKDNSLSGVEAGSGAGFYVPDGSGAANKYLAAGHYPNTLNAVLSNDASINVGYRCTNSNEWTCVDNFHLYYFGPLDLSEYETQLAQAVDAANNLVLPTHQKGILDAVVEENNKEYYTTEDYQTAIAAIKSATETAQPFVEPYAQYKQMRDMVEERFINQSDVYTDTEGSAASAYSSQLGNLNVAVEDAENLEDIETAKAGLWNAALSFLKSVTINEGQGFDLSWMIQDADFSDTNYKKFWTEVCESGSTHGVVGDTNLVMRYYNCNFDLSQKLPYILPAGAYRMKVDGFERTNDPMNTAWSDYQADNSTVTAVVYLNDNEQLLMNLFDVQSVTNSSLGGEQPGGASFYVANNSKGASKYIAAGYYPNELIGVLSEDCEATIGYRCANTKAWTCVDNFRLEFIGEIPTVEVTVNATEQLTPLCLPVTLNINDELVSQLYAVGGIVDGHAQLYPVNSVQAGTPCVAQLTQTTFRLPYEAVTYKTALLPWEGGFLQPDADNYTWTYVNLQDETTVASDLTFDIPNPMNMQFTVNLENLAARKYLTNVIYVGSSEPSVIANYNVAPPTRRDLPNAVAIPMPVGLTSAATITLNNGTVVTAEPGENLVLVYNLIPQQTYSYEVEAAGVLVSKGEFTTSGRVRMVYAPSAYNIRDLGGWKAQDGKRTTYGHLFRGSTLNGYVKCTAEDLQRLRDLGVGAEIDLRWKEDYEKDQGCGTSPFGFVKNVDYYFAAANDYTAGNLNESGTQGRLKEEFEFILNHFREGKAVYFHCAWGADRTGMLAFLLEGILGVEIDQIYKDYELTSFSAAPGAGNRLKTSFQDRINVILALSGTTLRDKFENYFLNKLGVSADDIAYFREVMLEDDGEPVVEPKPYEFLANEWPAGDPGRINAANVTIDEAANTITVSNTSGKNNVALRFQTQNLYYVTPELRYFTIHGTGFSTADGDTYLWWLNNANHASQVPPTNIYEDEGVTVFAWDIRTCGLGDNFSSTENTPLQTIGDWITTFGLTMSDTNVPAVISYIGFEETIPEPVEEYEYEFVASEWPAGDPGRISPANVIVDDEANTITVSQTGDNNIALNFQTEKLYYVTEGTRYFVIKGSGLSTEDTKTYLWWLNGKNDAGQIPPTTILTKDDNVTFIWDIDTNATFASGFNATGNSYLVGNGDSGWTTTFGLTLADATVPAVISYIGYVKADSPLLTGIEDVRSKIEDVRDAVYDLSGRRVAHPTQRGLYIRNGKKIMVK